MISRNTFSPLFSPQGISYVFLHIFFFLFVCLFVQRQILLGWGFTLELSSPLSSCQLISDICVLPQRSGGVLAVVFYTTLPPNNLSAPCRATHHHMVTEVRPIALISPFLSVSFTFKHNMVNPGIFLDFGANTTFIKIMSTMVFGCVYPPQHSQQLSKKILYHKKVTVVTICLFFFFL